MRKHLVFLNGIVYILKYKEILSIILRIHKGKNMDKKFITKPILRATEPMIDPLRKAYSEKLGVSVKQGEAISLAIKNEYKRHVKPENNDPT